MCMDTDKKFHIQHTKTKNDQNQIVNNMKQCFLKKKFKKKNIPVNGGIRTRTINIVTIQHTIELDII
jgi:hypothetical protein